ncbi:MAG: PIG-L family deacetylase [Armatimonadetes bacterium]|nr:PIG-L family deacetylase [Armatimonadota bacterium]
MLRRATCLLLLWAALARADTADVYRTGAIGVAHQLKRLTTTARVLHVAAHPDDEDSALLAYLARGEGARVAYYSLNRGEGGQNSIGPELYEPLGVIRTEELLAARRLDGAEQYFGLCFDFGFSKSADEGKRLWGEDAALGDLVELVRRFRPQVIISRFIGDASDGHGHHRFAGLITRRAFRAAADPQAFPEQLARGLQTWQASKLYLRGLADRPWPCRVPTGEFSPLYGRTYQALAFEGRSCHRTQDMGRIQTKGPEVSALDLADSVGGPYKPADPLFAGLDTSLAAAVPDSPEEWRKQVHADLKKAAEEIEIATAVYPIGLYPRQTVVHLAPVVRLLRRAAETLDGPAIAWSPDVATQRLAVHQKLTEAQQALVLSAGIDIDALADRELAAPGDRVTVSAQAFWRLTAEVDSARFRLVAPDGWSVEPLDSAPAMGNGRASAAQGFAVTVPAGAAPSQPYWLREPRQGNRFRVDDPAVRGLPFAPPALQLNLRCAVDGEPLSVTVPVEYRTSDPRRGERRAEVEVLPAVSAALQPDRVLLRAGHDERLTLTVDLHNHAAGGVSGRLLLRGTTDLPLGPAHVELAGRTAETLQLEAEVPAGWRDQLSRARLVWQAGGAEQPRWTVHRIAYEHIPARQYLTPCELTVSPLSVTTAKVKVGCIPGPTPETPAALRALGIEPVMLDEAALARGDASGLDVVVVCNRAYETNPALVSANPRLLDWVRGCGVMVVEYQKYAFVNGRYAPYPLTFVSPHDRVTEEDAAVTMLAPDHSLLAKPNRLGPPDFEGWVQERGLYFAHTWEPQYAALLSCHDTGEEDKQGGLLVAQVGKGAYVYCAYALFRQWEAGVPGAYRMLANLVSYAATR